MKFAFATTIPYKNEFIEVSGEEYVAWEDVTEKLPPENVAAFEWATFDFLIKNGHMVTKPDRERPKTTTTIPPIDTGQRTKKAGKRERQGGIGYKGYGDGFHESWSQNRILNERAKLLREQEKWMRSKQEAIEAAQKDLEWRRLHGEIRVTPFNPKFYNPDGTEYSLLDWIKVIVAAIIIIAFMLTVCRVA